MTTFYKKNVIHLTWFAPKAFCWILLVVVCWIPGISQYAYCDNLPNLGSPATLILSPLEEQKLGRDILGEIMQSATIFEDLIVQEYIQALGARLVATQSDIHFPFHFFILNENTINAFALPGGYIGLNAGLIEAADSESELAGVMAHEVVHVSHHHIARIAEHMGQVRLSSLAGILAAVIIGMQNPEAGTGALAATLAGSTQSLINFTREHEKEADFVGMQALNQAGFDPFGMPSFFIRMQQSTRYNGNYPAYLQTHPLTEKRRMMAFERAQEFPFKQVPDSLLFHLIKARLIVANFTSTQEGVQHYEALLSKGTYRSETGTRYGYALALMANKQPLEATSQLKKLIEKHPDEPLFQLALAQTKRETQSLTQARLYLEKAKQEHPHHYPIILQLTAYTLEDNEPKKALHLLRQQIQKRPQSKALYRLLVKAYADLDLPIQAHLAQAEYYLLQGNIREALSQLTLAKAQPGLTQKRSQQIIARIETLKTQLKQLEN